MKRIYRVLGLLAGILVTVLFVAYVVRTLHGHDLRVYATPRAAAGIVLAAFFWVAAIPLMAFAWRELLASLGVRRGWRELTAILGITQFAKYIPGNVAQYIGRVGMSLSRGIPARPLAVTIILETLLVVAGAIIVGVATGALSQAAMEVVRSHNLQLVSIALLVVAVVVGLFVLQRVAPALLRRFAPSYAPALEGTLLPSRGALGRALALCCLVYGAVGIGLVVLAHCLLPTVVQDNWLLIAAFSLAWVVGFVTPGAPGGLGVREGLLLLMLAPVYSAAAASILVIALRIATTLGDVIALLLGWLLLPRRRAADGGQTRRDA